MKSLFSSAYEENCASRKETDLEIVTSWLQKGLKKGLKKGLQQGRQEGEVAVVLRLLALRCGKLPEPVESRIRNLPAKKLETLTEALLDFKTGDDLKLWLDKNRASAGTTRATRKTDKKKPRRKN